MSEKSEKGRLVTGKVVSNKMHKTIVVEVERLVKHPKYGKFCRRRTKLYAHTPEVNVHVGALVTIRETRPLSKLKRWVLVKVVNEGTHQAENAVT